MQAERYLPCCLCDIQRK